MTAPKLSTGDPIKAPASFTRFVLPFGFRTIEPKSNGSRDVVFKQLRTNSSDFLTSLDGLEQRRSYLTTETAEMLFDRAAWFRLYKGDNEYTTKFVSAVNGKKTFHISNVSVVLFEVGNLAIKVKAEPDLFQTGFLLIEVQFEEGLTLPDIMNFNEVFRYTEEPYEEHPSKEWVEALWSGDLCKNLPTDHPFDCTRVHYDWWKHYVDFSFETGDGDSGKLFAIETGYGNRMVHPDLDQRSILPDNRSYVWTCVILPGESGVRSLALDPKCLEICDPSQTGYWAMLLNIDRCKETDQPYISATKFEKEWAKTRTYLRWEESGTLYGFTSHSGAMIGGENTSPPTHLHFGQMYFDQILILLYLRVGLFRFSAKLNRISAAAKNSDNQKKWAEQFRKLRWDLTLFTNLYQFPLLSNQQQAIEMYEIARKQMDVSELFREVQEEIHNSYEYLEQLENSEQSKQAKRLTLIAVFIAPVALVLGLFGTSNQDWGGAIEGFPFTWNLGPLSAKLISFLVLSVIYGATPIIIVWLVILFWKWLKSKR